MQYKIGVIGQFIFTIYDIYQITKTPYMSKIVHKKHPTNPKH